MKKILIFTFILSSFHVAEAQPDSPVKSATLVATNFTQKADVFIEQNKYDSARYYYEKAAEIYSNHELWNSFFYSQFQMGYYFNVQRKYKENLAYLDSIESNYGHHLSPMDSSYQRFYGIKSWAHFKLIQLDRALYYFNKLLDAANLNENVAVNDLLYSEYYKGIIYQRIGQYNLALAQMNLAKELCDKQGACSYLGNIYNNLGIIYRNLGEYQRSAEFYQKALTVLKKLDNEVGLTPIYNNLGRVYLFQAKYNEALKELNFALKVLRDYTQDYYQVESALVNTKSNVLIKRGEYKEAQEILETLLAKEVTKYGKKGPNSSETLTSLGKLYSERKLFKKSNAYFQSAIEITEQFLGEKNDKSAEINNFIGSNQLNNLEPLKALNTFQKSLIGLVSEFNNLDYKANPLLSDSILDRVELVEALFLKSEALLKLYHQDGLKKHLETAFATNKLATQLVEQVRNSLLYESSIINLSEKAKSIYEQSIRINFLNKERTQTTISNILSAIENSKSYTLVDAVQRAKSLGYSTQSEEAFNQESRLKTSVKLLESALLSATLSNKDSSNIYAIKQQIFEAKEALEKHENVSQVELKRHERGVIPTLETIQSKLEKGDLLIDYFGGESTLYAIAISNGSAKIYELGDYRAITNAFRKSITQNQQVNEFQPIAYKAFTRVLAPILIDFSHVDRLIIIPDKHIGYMPFDALLTEQTKSASFKKLPYLIKNYTVFQHQSATLYVSEKMVTETSPNDFIGFAPGFSLEELKNMEDRPLRNELQPLPFSKKEVELIAGLLKGGIETGKQASEKKFKEEASSFNIIHIASHAVVDEDNPLYSKLIFAAGDSIQKEDGNLYGFEIYGLKLNTQLVTLSACNTGSGKFYDGEGIFSLGRAFLMAGAKSVLASLWEVADQSTSEIMQTFYKNLKAGENKPEALRKAKLSYLKEADGLTANPFYWAAFVYTGTPQTVYNNYRTYYWVGGVFVVLLGFFTLYLKRRKE